MVVEAQNNWVKLVRAAIVSSCKLEEQEELRKAKELKFWKGRAWYTVKIPMETSGAQTQQSTNTQTNKAGSGNSAYIAISTR